MPCNLSGHNDPFVTLPFRRRAGADAWPLSVALAGAPTACPGPRTGATKGERSAARPARSSSGGGAALMSSAQAAARGAAAGAGLSVGIAAFRVVRRIRRGGGGRLRSSFLLAPTGSGSLFRAYRARVRAGVGAGAVRAPDCAREAEGAPLPSASRGFSETGAAQHRGSGSGCLFP